MRFVLPIITALALPAAAKDLLFEAFEGDGFGTWAETGEAFGKGPSTDGPGRIAGKVQGWANASFACSFHNGDSGKGMLTSPEFTIELSYIHFLVGGGNHKGGTSVQLLVDGKVVHEAVGENDLLLRPATWDVASIKGKKARIRILDARDAEWGLIMADHFVHSDAATVSFPPPAEPKKVAAQELVTSDAVNGLTIPSGTYAKVFATAKDHELISPTALCIDEQGNVLVSETHRFRFGVQDNRNHRYWILDDIASQSTADRRALHERFKDLFSIEKLTEKTEKVRFLADTNGDGVADTSKVFSEGYNDVLDGTAAGIFSFEGTAYFACIPHIWALRDKDGDGVAEEKVSLFEGFGTRVSISGHDLNGFALGPDGRIYGTIGDRSMRVTNKEGREYFLQNQGAAFRFDPDGSNFEVIHTGLRNPKEIAFDKWGNAVSVDNNSDQGDQARVVYIMEGADSGWRVGHQNLHTFHGSIGYKKRPINQWMEEKQWAPRNPAQPAFLLPPVGNLTNGPSGLTYQPGTGLKTNCEDAFLVCDYKGSAAKSGIWAFDMEADGASMAMVNPRHWNWGAAVTDVEFGYDGKIYVTDFIKGWQSHGGGRLYTISSEEVDQDPAAAEVAKLVSEGFRQRAPNELLDLLGHADQRVRYRAGLALSGKPEGLHLFRLAIAQDTNRLKRLQGVWGLWTIARKEQSKEATATLIKLLGDRDSEVRSQAARALGEAPVEDNGPLALTLRDPSARVRAFAAIALGRLKATDRFNDVVVLLAENKDKDIYLRHAGIMGLVGCSTPEQLVALKDNPSNAVRIAAVVALRRLQDPGVVAFLFDEDHRIADEVIRAVNDTPIEAGRPAIAALLHDYIPEGDGRSQTRMLLRRIVHSSFRLGTPESAANLLQFSANPQAHLEERLEALRLLAIWANPPSVDQSLGRHMQFPARDIETILPAFEAHLPALLAMDGPVLTAAIELSSQYGVAVDKLDDQLVLQMVNDPKLAGPTRARSLELLVKREHPSLKELLPKLIDDEDDTLAIRALGLFAELQPTEAIHPIRKVIGSANDRRKQQAWTLLATLPVPEAVTELTRGLASFQGSTRYPAYALELLAAAEARPEDEIKKAIAAFRASIPADDPLGEFRLALRGGDPARGAALFQSHPSAQCMKCHRTDTGHSAGGEAGPNLADIGTRHDEEFILRSLVNPNADITPGFGLISVTFLNGAGTGGILMDETETTMDIKSGTDLLRINKSDIKEQTIPVSAMLPTNELLTKHEMRDLVSWLVTRRDKPVAQVVETKEPILLDPATLVEEEPAPKITTAKGHVLDPKVMKAGKNAYALCAICHGPQGRGVANLGPPLALSEWVNGPPENLIRIQLRGLQGPIRVNGQEYIFAVPMPPQIHQTDEQIAAVLTYVRNSFGNSASPVTPDMVAALRDEAGKPILTVKDLIPVASAPVATGPKPRSVFEDDDGSSGLSWWAILLILFWIGACLIPVVKQWRRKNEEEEE